MSLRAYQQAAQRAETPRDVEYRLFAQVTRALLDVKSTPREDVRAWIDVLHWNRRMWAALADDCAQPDEAQKSRIIPRTKDANLREFICISPLSPKGNA